jgi:PAS domain S-box-containing protein
MATPLRCLVVEDSESDARLIVRALKKAGYEVLHERVETPGQMRDALKEQVWDAVVADYTLPEFGAPAALAMLREIGPDLPFIVVSGTMGENAAVAMMRAGAHDYLLKADLPRLGPAVARELGAAEVRRKHRRAQDALWESEARFRSVVEGAPAGIVVGTQGRFRYLNPVALKLFGAASDVELLNQPIMERLHPDYHAIVAELIRQVDEIGTATAPLEEKFLKLDGTVFDVEVSAEPYMFEGERGVLLFFQNITERVQHDAEKEATLRLLHLCSAPTSQRELIRSVTGFLQTWSGCEAVGIRLAEGFDFPYYETRGFPPEFVRAESQLCARDAEQEMRRDSQGNPVLECMCGNVLCGRFDPRKPFFTEKGSFWTNCTSELLASTTEADRQNRTRNRCNGEGYESVALFRMAFAEHTIGLLQLNDKRKDRFNPGLIEFLERVASTLAAALEQRLTQAAQWESEARYRSLFQNMREGFAHCKMEFRQGEPQDFVYLDVNHAFEPLTGLQGVVGRRISEVIPGVRESNPELLKIYGRVSLTGAPETFESYVAPLGRWFSVAAYGAAPEHFVAVFDNITERKQAEERLRASEARYRLIADNTSDVIWTMDVASSRITYVSPSVGRLRGYSPEEVLTQSLGDILTPESYGQVTSLLAERAAALESGDESARTAAAEMDLTCKDGSVVATELVATLLTDARGHVTDVVGVSRDITQRKKAEAALRQSEERARLLADMLERSSQPFTTAKPDGRIEMANAAYCGLVGYSQDELRTLNWVTDLTPLEWREVTPAFLAEVRMKGNPVRYEKEYVRKDGLRVPVEILANLVRDSTGEPSYYYAFVTDLTERRQAQQALQQSEQRYRELFENAQFGVYRSTPDGRILLVNPAMLAMLGYSFREELAERNLEADGFEPGYDRGWFKDTLERHGRIRDHEAKWTRRDGNPVYVLESAIAVRDAHGAVLYYDGTVEDITARKQIADALHLSEERFRQVAEDAGVFVWEVDADGLYTYASPVVEAILGYAPNELIGKLHDYDLFAPDDREELKAIVTEAFAQRRSFSSFLNANVRKDGKIVILETNAVPMLDAAGNLLGYRGTDRDVTDRALATEELRKHRDHLGELVKERTEELAVQNRKLSDEVFAHSLALEALKRSEAHLQLQFDSMPSGCITIGPDAKIQSWNPSAERIFGYSGTEAVGTPVVDLLVPEDLRSEVRPFLRRLFETTESVARVNDNVTKDGLRITCEWSNTLLLDPDGFVRGILCMVQDITSRKQAEEAVKRKTEELEIFNKAMIGRESRVIELKEEINRLCTETGRPPAYPPVWNGEQQ